MNFYKKPLFYVFLVTIIILCVVFHFEKTRSCNQAYQEGYRKGFDLGDTLTIKERIESYEKQAIKYKKGWKDGYEEACMDFYNGKLKVDFYSDVVIKWKKENIDNAHTYFR